jgi:hypothetical protein
VTDRKIIIFIKKNVTNSKAKNIFIDFYCFLKMYCDQQEIKNEKKNKLWSAVGHK